MALAARGVETTERRLKNTWGPGRVEMTERVGFEFVERSLSRRSFHFPEIYFATDDCLARGMLAAFMVHGVDVPKDVRFACVACHGFRPLYSKSLSLVEIDPYGRGEDVASQILSWLTEHRPISRSALECRFVEGETFP
jgi:DNA-binding LacI/PurR family transcriptional regulator